MKQETKTTIDLMVLQTSVAYLLAQHAKDTGTPLAAMHTRITNLLTKRFQELWLTHPTEALEGEVVVANATDHLWGIASAFLDSMSGQKF